jgi:hypothetical protein
MFRNEPLLISLIQTQNHLLDRGSKKFSTELVAFVHLPEVNSGHYGYKDNIGMEILCERRFGVYYVREGRGEWCACGL